MNIKQELYKYIDAVINENSEAEKASFKNFCENKTKQILGVKLDLPLSEEFNKSIKIALTEAQIDDDIEIDGSDTVFVRGKRVGKLGYAGTDETGDATDLFFQATDGKKYYIKNNEIEDLVMILRNKYLGAK